MFMKLASKRQKELYQGNGKVKIFKGAMLEGRKHVKEKHVYLVE